MIDTAKIKLLFTCTVILLAGALHASMANAQTVALSFETATEHARDVNGNVLLLEGSTAPLPPDIDTSGSTQTDTRTVLQIQLEGLVHSNQMRLTLNSFDWFVLRVSIADREAGLVSVTRPNFGTAPHARIDIEPIKTSTSRALLIPNFDLSRPAAPASGGDLEHALYSIFVGGRAISVDDVAGLVPDTCFDPTSTNQNIYTGDINELPRSVLATTGALNTTITITSANNNRDFHGDQLFTASVTRPCSSVTLGNLPPQTFMPLPEPIPYRMRDDDVPYVAMNGERLLAEGAFLDPDDISNTVSHINSEGDTFTAPIRLVRGKADQVVIGGADEFLIDQPNYSSAPLMLYLGINSRFSPGFRTLEIGEDFRVLDRFSQPLDVAIGPIRDHANNNNPLLNIAADFNRYFLVRVDPGMARLVGAQFEILEDNIYEVLADDPLSPTAYQPQERLQIGLIGVARSTTNEGARITVYDYPRLPNAEGYIVNRGVSETVGRSRGALDHYSVDLRTNNTTTMHISLAAIPSTFIPGATIRIGYSLSAHVATRLPFLNMSLGDIGNPNQLAEHITPCSPTSGVLPCQTEVFSDPPVLGGNVAVRINSDAIPNQFIEVAHFIIAEDAPLSDFAGVFMNWDFRMRTLDDNLSLGAISVPTQPAPSYTDLYSLVQLRGASLTRAGAVIAVPSGQSVPSVLTETHVRPVIFEPNPADHCAGNNPITTTLIGERDLCVRPEESWDIYGVLLNPVTNSLRVVENTGTSTLALPFNFLPDIDYAWEPNPAVLSDQDGAATPTFAPGESSKYLGTLSILADSYVEQDEVIQLKVGVIRGVTQFVPQGNIVVLDYFADAFDALSLPGSVLPDVFAQGAAMTILDSDRRFYSLLSLQQMDGTFEFVDVPARITESATPLDIIRFKTATFFRWGGDTLELNDVFGSAVTTLSTTLGAVLILPNLPPPISVSTDLGEDFRNQDDTSIASLRSTSFDIGRGILLRYGFDSNVVPAGTRARYTLSKQSVFTPDANERPNLEPLVIQLAEPPVGMGGTNDPTFALPVRFLSDAQIAANEFATLLPPEYASVGALNASTPIIGVVNSTATYRFQASSDMTMLLQFVLAHPSNPLPTDISTLALTLKRGDTTLGHAHVLQTVDITSLASKLYIGFAGQTRSLRDGGAGLQGVQCNNDALRSNPELVSADDNAYFIQAIHDGDRGDLSEYTLEIEIPPSASAYFGENASWLEIRSEIACVQGPVEDNPVSTDDIVYANFHSVPCTASTEGLADPAVCALATQQLRYTDDDFLISAIEASDVALDLVLDGALTVTGGRASAVLTEQPAISMSTDHIRGIRFILDPPYAALETDSGTLPQITLLLSPSGISAEHVLLNPHVGGAVTTATIIGANPTPVTGVTLNFASDDGMTVVVASAIFSVTPDNIYDINSVLEIAIPPTTNHPDARTVSLDLLVTDQNNHIIGAPCQNAYLHDTVCPPITAVETTSSGIINLQYGGIMREDTITRLRVEWDPPSVGSVELVPLRISSLLPAQTLPNGKRSVIADVLLGAGTDQGPFVAVVPENLQEGEMFVIEMGLFVEDPPLAVPSDDSYAQGLGLNTTSTVTVAGHPSGVLPDTYDNIGPIESAVEEDEGQNARYTMRAAAGVSIAMTVSGVWPDDAQILITAQDAIDGFDSIQLTGADLMAATDNVVYMTFYDDRLAESAAPATCAGINADNQLVIPHTDTADNALSEYAIDISIPEDENDTYYNKRPAYTITHDIACTSLSPGNLPSAINLECETTLPTPAHCTSGPPSNPNREVQITYRDNDGYIDTLVLRDAINPNPANDLNAFFEIGSNTENMMLPERVVLLASLPGTNASGSPLILPVMARDLSSITERTIMHGTSLVPKNTSLTIALQIEAGQSTAMSDVFTAPANTGYQPPTPMSVTYLGADSTTSREFIVRDAADNFIGFSNIAFQRQGNNVALGRNYPIVFRLHEPAIEDVNLMVRFTLDHPSQANLNRMENLVRGPDTPIDGAFTSQTHTDGSTLYEIVVAYNAGDREAHALNLSYPDSVYELLQTANINQGSVLLTGLSTSASDTLDGTRFVASRSVSLGTRPDLSLFVGGSALSIIAGFLPGDVAETNRPNFDNYPSVFDDHTVIGENNAIHFALSVLASDQLGDIGIGGNPRNSGITITWEARLLLDGQQVAFNNPAQPNPYPDYLVLLDADDNEQGVFSTSGLQTTTTIPAGQSTATFKWAIRDDPSITPARTLELDQLSVRLRITSVADTATSIRADASSLSYTLRDTTRLPLGFEFISVTAGEDGQFPIDQGQYTQGQYPGILANLNNAAMRDDEHALPEGAIMQFRPRLEDDGNPAPYRVRGTADKFIDIPLVFEAGTHTPRFGGAFVALRGMGRVTIDSPLSDNRCRLITARDPANDAINLDHTVDYCLQQRGLASANARRTLDSEPLLGNTTGTSTVLADDANGVSQLSLRLATGTTLNTVATANNPADDPFTHLLMGMVIAAPHLPTTLVGSTNRILAPISEANYDLILEPDEHFVMRWSTTDTRIVDVDNNQRRFIIRGHSPQSVLSYSERFARAEFGLSEPSTDALRYIPHFELAPPLHQSVLTVMAVPESQSIMVTLRWVGDTITGITADANAQLSTPLYYTDTISREFALDINLTSSVNTIDAALPQSLQIGNATLPATDTPAPLELQFTITGLEDLNAINEQFLVMLARVREVTPSLPGSISQAARTTVSTSTISLQLLLEEDDNPPPINLSYRLFDLGDNPYTNTAGTLTQNTLDGYRVQGSAAIVPVARDSANQNLLDTAAMPRFPDSLSRYRFGVDFPEHDLSLPAPPALGTIVGRGDFLADLDDQPIDLAPHYELYAAFITPDADALEYELIDGPPTTPAPSETFSFAGLVHPHNLAQTSTAIISAAAVGTRQARDNRQISQALRNVLGTSAEHVMLFARLSHNPDDLDTSLILASIAEDCPVIENADALGADGNTIVSINDHRHATGSADKLEQPFSILNILGSDATDNAALYQYGYRENIATMNVALLCASDPSLSPDLNDNLNADGSAGPEYCATRMVDGYCQVGTYDLNYTDYLPEFYDSNPFSLLERSDVRPVVTISPHKAPLYEADATAGITLGFEGLTAIVDLGFLLCRTINTDPVQRCNQLTWNIRGLRHELDIGFYDEHSPSQLLTSLIRVNTQGDSTRLQMAMSVVAVTTPTVGDFEATSVVRMSSVNGDQAGFDNPNRNPANFPADLAVDSLTWVTSVIPSSFTAPSIHMLFVTQANENQRYRHCAIPGTSTDQIRECVEQRINLQLRVEPSLVARVYDATNSPVYINHPVIEQVAGNSLLAIVDPDVYVLLQTTAGDGTLSEANPGEDGSFVDLSVRFGGTSAQMADRLDLALIFYTDTDTALQLHAETSNTNTATPFFPGVANPAKAGSDLVVQARGNTLPYGGLWSAPEMDVGSADANPLALTLFADEAGILLESSSVTSSVDLNDEATINAHPILGTNRVLLALRYPAIAPSDQPQLLARVYVNADDDIAQGTRSLRVALGILGASDSIGTGALQSLDYLQVTDPEDSNSMVHVNTARHIGATYLPNYLGLQVADPVAFATPVTQHFRLLDDDDVTSSTPTNISVVNAPSSSNILVEQDIVSAVHQLHLSNLDAPYLDESGTLVTPTNVGVLFRLDFSVPNDARVSPNNMFSVRLRDTDNSNDSADTRLIGALGTIDNPNPVYVLLGNPNFVSDHCAGIDLSNDINPIAVGDSADRTQDAGASLTLEIFATGGQTDSDFYGDQAIVYTPHVLCSNHQLYDAQVDNRALAGHACNEGTLSTLVVGTETLDACALANSPIIGVVETAQIDIVISAELTGGSSASHDFSNNLILSAPEPDAARPAIEREAIVTPTIQLRATLSDGATNRSGSAIALNRVTNQLNQFASQFTFVPSPGFMATGGIPDGASQAVGTLLITEDELMEGTTDYPLLVAGATDYIVATRASAIRAQIHTQLPMVDNPLTGVPEQQAAGYVFRMALDLTDADAAMQVQNRILPTIRVIDADDYFHYLVEGPAIDTAIVAEAVLNQFPEAAAPVVNLRIGLGGTHIAWGGNNPTNILSDASARNMVVQVLSDAEFDAAAFLDSEAPTHTDRSLFIHTDSTADHQGASRDVTIELPSSAVNIVRESNTALASYRSNQAWWQLRFAADMFNEGDEYIEIALSMRETNPTNPAMPRALRRLGPATHLRYQLDEIDPELFLFAQPTAISSQQNRYPLPIISEYLASDIVAGEPSVHATVSTLAVVALPPNGMVMQLDVYGHLANRDGDLILGRRAYATDETIPQSRLGGAVQIAGTSVRRFYLQLGNQTPACLAASGITTERVFETSAPVIGANGLIEFPIGLGTRRPSNKHASVHYGGTRVLRLSASVLCSDDSNYPAGTRASHVWSNPDVVNTLITDTRGIPVLLRDRADDFTLSYFVATTESLPQAGFTPRTQFGLHEAGVARPLPNTFARLHVHAALIPTSASFGDAPIIPASDLQAPIPISSLRAMSTGICEGTEDCIPTPDTNTNNYYLGSIRAGADNSNTWEPNGQLQLIGAGTRDESTADFASEWLLPNSAIVLDPVQSTQMGRNALLVSSVPSVLFDNRVFNAPAAILSSIAPQRITLQDAQSYIAMSAATPAFMSRAGIAGGLPVAEFELNLGGVPTQTPVEPLTALSDPLQIKLGFVFGFTTPTTNSSKARPSFSIEGAGEQFIANSDPDARDPAMLTLTPTLGFDTGDSHTTSTLTIDNGHYFEASLTVSDDPSITSTQQRRVVLRVVYNDAFDANLIRYGTLQAHLVAPPADADYYIYPENDPIAPSAINLMIDSVDTPIVSCAQNFVPGTSMLSNFAQPYPRDCLRARSRSAYAFTVDTMGLDFVVQYDSQESALTSIHNWTGGSVRVHYYSPDNVATCEVPPASGALSADSQYVSGRYASNTVFALDEAVSETSFSVDTRATGPAGTSYCVVLEANAGVNAFTTPVRIDLPDYSTDDDNNNGLPDDIEVIDPPIGSSPTIVYIRDYCRRVGSLYDPDLGARNDCDHDGVPDLAELQYGPPEDNNDYTLMRALCIAESFYTRFPRTNSGNLLCTDLTGDQPAATQIIAGIESDWLLAIRGNNYAGVALEIARAGPSVTFRANIGLLPANRYWFVDPDNRQMAEIFIAPALRFRVPSAISSSRDGHRFVEVAGTNLTPVGPYFPMSVELLGNMPKTVAGIINLELEGYDQGTLIATHLDEFQFTANSGLRQDIGTYRSSTLGFSRGGSDSIQDFYATPRLDSVTAGIHYAVCLDEPNHPLHGTVLNDRRRAHERYEVGIPRADAFDLSDAILPAGLQLINAPTEASLTSALPASAATMSTLDFVLREHGILTQNAGVLYLGPHPNISTPTALSSNGCYGAQSGIARSARAILCAFG